MRDRREPNRRCVVTRESGPRHALVRFVIGPEEIVIPDLEERLPGRGVWVGARRELVRSARKGKLFSRALRSPTARAEPDLEDQIEAALARRVVELLGLARRSGGLVAGYEKTRARLKRGPVGALIEALDGAPDGCNRLRALQPRAKRIGCLYATELGSVFGRTRTVHAALDPGGIASTIFRDAKRLEGFRTALPPVACENAAIGLS